MYTSTDNLRTYVTVDIWRGVKMPVSDFLETK